MYSCARWTKLTEDTKKGSAAPYTVTSTAIISSVWAVEANSKKQARMKVLEGQAEPLEETILDFKITGMVYNPKQASPAK